MRYAAIFVRDTWPDWATYEALSPERHRTEFFRHLHAGYRLVVQSVTEYKVNYFARSAAGWANKQY